MEPRVDLASLSGCPAAEAARVLEAEGFRVEVLDLDTNPMVTMDYRDDRVRVWHRNSVVENATHG